MVLKFLAALWLILQLWPLWIVLALVGLFAVAYIGDAIQAAWRSIFRRKK